MRKHLWVILTVLLVAIGATNARADSYSFAGVVACGDTTPCGGSSTFDVTGTYTYDPTTQSIGVFSFVTPIGTIASTPTSYTFAGLSGGSFFLAFYAFTTSGVPSNSPLIQLAFSPSDTEGDGPIVIGAFDTGSSVCQLVSNGGCPTSSTSNLFNFISGASTDLSGTPAPEPASLAMLGVGLLGLAGLTLKRTRVAL